MVDIYFDSIKSPTAQPDPLRHYAPASSGSSAPEETPTSFLLNGKLPEEAISLNLDMRLKNSPELRPLIVEIQEAYRIYNLDDLKEAEKRIKEVESWTVSDLLSLVKRIKDNWNIKNENNRNQIREIFGRLPFRIRAALINTLPANTRPQGGRLVQGDIYFSRPDFFVIEGSPDAPAQNIGEKSAWEVPELADLRKEIEDAYKGYQKEDFSAWKAKRVLELYRNILKHGNDKEIDRIFGPLREKLKVVLSALDLLIQDSDKDFIWYLSRQAQARGILNKSAWEFPPLAQLKDKVKAAYKKCGQNKNVDNWKVSDLLARYARTEANLKADGEINECFGPLLPEIYQGFKSLLQLNFNPAEGQENKKIRFFAKVYQEVRNKHLELKRANGKGFEDFPETEVLSGEDIKTVFSIWGRMKRGEYAEQLDSRMTGKYGGQNAVIKGFEKLISRSPVEKVPWLVQARSYIWKQIANDPSRLDDQNIKLTRRQESLLYEAYQDDAEVKKILDQINGGLTPDLKKAIDTQAKERAVDFFLSDPSGNTSNREAMVGLRAEVSALAGKIDSRKQFLEYIKASNRFDPDQRKELEKKYNTELSNLETELRAKKEELESAEKSYTASLGEKFKEIEEQQKLAIIWEYTSTVASYLNNSFEGDLKLLAGLYNLNLEGGPMAFSNALASLKSEESRPGDLEYAKYLTYKDTEGKEPPPLEGSADYLTPIFGQRYLASSLPVIYQATKRPKSADNPKEEESYKFEELDLSSANGRTLIELIRLSAPDGKVEDPVSAFTISLSGHFDQRSWFSHFPNSEAQEQIQRDQMRRNIHWEQMSDNPKAMGKLAKSLGTTVDSPDFELVKQVLSGNGRLVVKAPHKEGLLDDQNVKFFLQMDGKLVELTAAQRGVFKKLYLGYTEGQHVSEKTEAKKLELFLNSYSANNAMFSAAIEGLAFELAMNIVETSKDNPEFVHKLKEREFKQMFFNSLVDVLKLYLVDKGVEAPLHKLTRIISAWHGNYRQQIIQGLWQQAANYAKNLDKLEKIPGMDEKLELLENIKSALTKIGKQLIDSGLLAESANKEQLLGILNNVATLSDRILFYIETDFSPLGVRGDKSEETDNLNKTRYHVIDTFVMERMARNAARMEGFEIGSIEAPPSIDLQGKYSDLKSFQSMHQWMWQEPAAVVLLYFESRVEGKFKPFDFKDGTLFVRNTITWQDLENIIDWNIAKHGNLERAGKLRATVQQMKGNPATESDDIVFGNDIFAGIIQGQKVEITASSPEIKEAIEYLRKWFTMIMRVTQPVAGAMYREIVASRMRQEPDKSWGALGKELWESASTLPAPMVLKMMQMIDSDKTLALKETLYQDMVAILRTGGTNLPPLTSEIDGTVCDLSRTDFEGFDGASSWDAETIWRFAVRYEALFEHPLFNTAVLGEHGEKLVENPVVFLKNYAKKLKSGGMAEETARNKRISLALSADDSEEDQVAKLLIQQALMLWKPDMKPYDSEHWGSWKKEGLAAGNFALGQLFGMDDTSPSYNYLLRFKGFLLKMGYRYSEGFSMLDEKVTANMIVHAGKHFENFMKPLDPESKVEMLKIFFRIHESDPEQLKIKLAKAEENVGKMIKAMKEYPPNGKTIEGLSYTDGGGIADFFSDRDYSEIKPALVFFARNIVPNYGAVVEGESESNFVNLPIMLAAQANKWDVKKPPVFGGIQSAAAARGSYRIEVSGGKGGWDHLTGALSKGFHFGLFMHPTIQLGMQTALFTKLTRHAAAGEWEGVKATFKEMAMLRLSFLAFQYRPDMLLKSALGNFEQGNWADGGVDLTFAMHALTNILRLAKRGTTWLANRQFMEKLGIKMSEHRLGWLKNMMKGVFVEVETEARSRMTKEVLDAKFDPKLKWTLKRAISTAKVGVFEPITTVYAELGIRYGELPILFKQMIACAQNPNEMFTFEAEKPILNPKTGKPVLGPDGKPLIKRFTYQMRGADYVRLTNYNLSPALVRKVGHAVTQFLPHNIATQMPLAGKPINVLLNLITNPAKAAIANTTTAQRATRWASPLQNEIIPNLEVANADAIRAGNFAIEDIIQVNAIEAQNAAHKNFKYARGRLWRRIAKFVTFGTLATSDAGQISRDITYSMDSPEAKRLSGNYLVDGLILKDEFGKPAFKNWKKLNAALRKAGRAFPDAKVAQLHHTYMQHRRDLVIQETHNFAQEVLSPEVFKAVRERGYLTEAEFKKVYEAKKAEIKAAVENFDRTFVERATAKPKTTPALKAPRSKVIPAEATRPAAAAEPVKAPPSPKPIPTPAPEPLPVFARSGGMSIAGLGEVVPIETSYHIIPAGAPPSSEPFIITGLNGNLEQVIGRNPAEFANSIRDLQKLGIEEIEFRGNGKGYFSAELTAAELAELPGKVDTLKKVSGLDGAGRAVVLVESDVPGTKFTVKVEPVFEVTPDMVVEEKPSFTTRELTKIGLTQQEAAEFIRDPEAFIEKHKTTLGEAHFKKLVEFLRSEDAAKLGIEIPKEIQELLRNNPNPTAAQAKEILTKAGVSFMVQLVTLLGAEKLAEVLGINHPAARFAFILGLAHTSNVVYEKIAEKGLRAMLKGVSWQSFKQTVAPKSLGKFSFNLVQGFGEMYIAGMIYEGLLNIMGISEGSIFRSGTAKLIASMGLPTLVKTAVHIATALEAAGTKTFLTRLLTSRFLSAAVGEALTGAGLVLMASELVPLGAMALVSNSSVSYSSSVAGRTFDELLMNGDLTEDNYVQLYLAAFSGYAKFMLTTTKNNAPKYTYQILEGDRKASEEMRAFLRAQLFAMLLPYLSKGDKAGARALLQKIFGKKVEYKDSIIIGYYSGSSSVGSTYGINCSGSSNAPIYLGEKTVKDEIEKLGKKNPNLTQADIVEHLVRTFKVGDQYVGALSKMVKDVQEKMPVEMLQKTAGSLAVMDPDGFLGVEKGLNSDIRKILDEDGTFKEDESPDAFLSWVLDEGKTAYEYGKRIGQNPLVSTLFPKDMPDSASNDPIGGEILRGIRDAQK